MSIITGTGIFTDTSSNLGTVTVAEFTENSVNSGVVVTSATFSGSSSNEGTIEGNATFAGTSTNAAGTTINGSVVFSSGSINNGTIANAIFLDGAINGPTGVVTNATFTGTSVNQGAVTNGTFTENTAANAGTVTNPTVPTGFNNNTGTFTNTSITYNQADGAFSYGYFSGGIKTAPPSYQTVVYQVGNFWYKYDASGNAALAQGEFNDGTSLRVFKNGLRTSVGTIVLASTTYYYELPLVQGSILYTNNTITNKAVAATGAGLDIDGNLEEDDWVISAGGAIVWGDIPRNGAYNDGYYSSDTIANGYTSTTPQTARNSLGDWYVYTSGIAASANGAYTNGYFTNAVKSGTYSVPQSALDNNSAWFIYTSGVPTSATGSYTVGKFSSGVKTGTTTTPVTALDSQNVYYIYNSGDPSLASGAYSNGYFATGTIDSGYSNSTPFTPQDSGFYYVYSAGEASKATGVYSNGAFTNGLIYNLNSTAPQQATDDQKWYMYTSGSVSVTADGVYSNGYYEAGVKNVSYANTLPQSAANEVGKWYVFASGIPTAASGAYTNGYYVAGEISGTVATPVSALNNSAAWFIYTNGVPTSANGAYSNGYFNNGVKDTEYDSLNGTPEDIPQDNTLWYVFTNGVPITASGAYSNGYYTYGSINSNYNSPNSIPEDSSQDDILWYIYTNGVPSVATGAYTNGYFVAGAKTGNITTPLTAQNNNQLWYTYTSGTALTASGTYSNGFYIYGTLNQSHTNSLPQSGKDSGIWYVFTSGVQTSANGLYSNYAFNSNGSINTNFTTVNPQSALNDNLWYTYNAGVATTAISSIELNNVTYYHIGNLNNGVSKLYSNSSVTTLVVDTSGADDVTGDQVNETWRTNNLGKFYWSVPKSLNSITYYYEGQLISNQTVFYTTSSLSVTAVNLSGTSDDVNNDSIIDQWVINNNGIISWSKEIVLGGTTYYYFGQLNNAKNPGSGTTVLYTNSGLTTIASNLTGFDRVQVIQQQEDIYNNWYTDYAGNFYWYESTKITSEGTDYFYTRDAVSPYSILNGYTVLYTDSSLSSVVVSLTGVNDLNNDTSNETWSTDANGVISWVSSITLQSTPFYYQGRLVGGNTPALLYTDYTLETLALVGNANFLNYTGVNDFDGDSKRERITINSNSEAITNSVYQLSSSMSQLWVEDPVVSGTTIVWSNDTLTTQYNSGNITERVAVGISNALYSLHIPTYGNTLYFTPIEPIVDIFTNNTYYISKALSADGTFVFSVQTPVYGSNSLLWNSNNNLAAASVLGGVGLLSGISVVDGQYYKWVWNKYYSIFDTIDIINPLAVDGGTYYYTGTLTSSTTILYLTPALSSVAANLSGTNDIYTEDPADSWTEEYWQTNGSGVLTWQAVNTTLTNSVTTVYFLGTMTNNGTTIFQDSDLNQPLVNSSGSIDINGTTYSFTTNANGIITYVNSSSFTIRGTTYYYETGAGFNNGQIAIYTTNTLVSAATNLSIYENVTWGPGGQNPAIITTDSSGVLSWNTSVGGPIDWEGDAEDYYYAGSLTSGSTNIYKASDGMLASNTSGVDSNLPGVNGNQYVTVTNGVISWTPVNTITLNSTSYYYTGTLTSASTILYTDNLLTTLAADLNGTDTIDSNNSTWSTNANGVISWSTISSESVSLGNTTYYYEAETVLTSGTTILYTDNALTTIAASLNGVATINGSNSAWSTDASGVITWAAVNTISINSTSYYYTGSLAVNTILYTNDTLTTTAASITGVASGTYYATDANGAITTADTVNTVSISSTSYYYTGSLAVNTVLYTNDTLTTTAASITGVASGTYYETDGSGAITTADTINTVSINSTSYYYTGSLIVGTILYTNDTLTTAAASITGVASNTYYETDANGEIITADPINTLTLNGTSYYCAGSVSVGNILYTDNNLTTTAGNITGASSNLYYETDANGEIITVVPVNTVSIASTSYYYVGSLIVNTILYTNDTLTTTAASITGVGSGTYYVTDASGAITTADTVNTVSINSTSYYYTGSLAINTILYTNDTLTTAAASITGVGSGTYYATDANGAITTADTVNTITLNSTPYYYTGTLTTTSTVLYTDNTLETLATSVTGPDPATQDLDSDGNYDSWSIDGNGVISWSMDIVYESSWNGYYHTGSLTSGTTVLYNGQGSGASLATGASGTYDFGSGDTSWSTDGSGVISWS